MQAVSLVTTQLHLKSLLTDDDAAGPLFFTDRLVGKHSSSLPLPTPTLSTQPHLDVAKTPASRARCLFFRQAGRQAGLPVGNAAQSLYELDSSELDWLAERENVPVTPPLVLLVKRETF